MKKLRRNDKNQERSGEKINAGATNKYRYNNHRPQYLRILFSFTPKIEFLCI